MKDVQDTNGVKKILFFDPAGIATGEWKREGDTFLPWDNVPIDGVLGDVQSLGWISAFLQKSGYGIALVGPWGAIGEEGLRKSGIPASVPYYGTILGISPEAEIQELAGGEEVRYLWLQKNCSDISDFLRKPTALTQRRIPCHGRFGRQEYEEAVGMAASLEYLATSPLCIKAEGENEQLAKALNILFCEGKLSTSLLQRRLGIGYGAAARLVDRLVTAGVITVGRNMAAGVLLPTMKREEILEALGLSAE